MAGRAGVGVWWLLAVAALVLACGDDPPPPEPVVRPIKILDLSHAAAAEEVLEFPGTVTAGETATLAFEVAGKLVELPVTEGQDVAAGALLASLDPRDFEIELEAQDAQLAKARADMERARKLFSAEVISPQEFEVAKRNYEVALARSAGGEKTLSDTRLVAPFAGVVARIDVKNFENVQAKQSILVLENMGAFDVNVGIPEQDAARLEPGLTLEERSRLARPEVELSSLPGRTFAARVSEFSTTADASTRTFAATFRFDNPGDVSISSGMTAKVRVHVPEGYDGSAGLQVPAVASASDDQGAAYVWVVDPQSMAVSRTPVGLGVLTEDRVQIVSGLEGDEWIAVSGVHQLREGMVVRRLED